ncbi:MAG: hypothetical protein M3Y86_04090 [Verrucomicrobiota bacterium]|nr:hypothetical protein [Verrucomicrobiota bacterium]
MKKLTCICTALLLVAGFVSAAEPAPAEGKPSPAASAAPATAPEEKPVAPPPQLEVKNKSSFALDESGRNPFWPIGWRPATKIAASERSAYDISPNVFLVSSITVDTSGRFAIINGKVMTEGQVFGLQMGNQTYQVTVKAIQDGQVILARRDEEIVVPLHRR